MQFLPATCPTCSGHLQLPDDVENVKCLYCGNNIVVKQAVQGHGRGSIENFMKLAQAASKSGNSSEAYQYYTKVLEMQPENPDAWLGKAEAAAWMSTLRDFRIPEMLSGFASAIEFALPERKNEIKLAANRAINSVAIGLYNAAQNHMLEYVGLDNAWTDYLAQCELLLQALQTAHAYDPTDRLAIENIIHICTVNIQGIKYNDPYRQGFSRLQCLSGSYEKEIRILRQQFGFKLNKLDPSYQLPEVNRQSPPTCFVATTVMGDPEHPDVLSLREFRDEFLSRFSLGRHFIRSYYQLGPVIARFVENRSSAKLFCRVVLVKPFVFFVRLQRRL